MSMLGITLIICGLSVRKDFLECFSNIWDVLIALSLVLPLLIAGLDFWYYNKHLKSQEYVTLCIRFLSTAKCGFFMYAMVLILTMLRLTLIKIDTSTLKGTLGIDYAAVMPGLIGAYITVYVAFITFILVAVQLASV